MSSHLAVNQRVLIGHPPEIKSALVKDACPVEFERILSSYNDDITDLLAKALVPDRLGSSRNADAKNQGGASS